MVEAEKMEKNKAVAGLVEECIAAANSGIDFSKKKAARIRNTAVRLNSENSLLTAYFVTEFTNPYLLIHAFDKSGLIAEPGQKAFVARYNLVLDLERRLIQHLGHTNPQIYAYYERSNKMPFSEREKILTAGISTEVQRLNSLAKAKASISEWPGAARERQARLNSLEYSINFLTSEVLTKLENAWIIKLKESGTHLPRLKQALRDKSISSREKDIIDRYLSALKGKQIRPSPRKIQRPWGLKDRPAIPKPARRRNLK
ncbi:MAG: hypothetical protein Q7R70_06980 [Candidatus Diapherotrites archaeon]|nr:hypothetical protein [Candidatus Diapherotrites archaeon]